MNHDSPGDDPIAQISKAVRLHRHLSDQEKANLESVLPIPTKSLGHQSGQSAKAAILQCCWSGELRDNLTDLDAKVVKAVIGLTAAGSSVSSEFDAGLKSTVPILKETGTHHPGHAEEKVLMESSVESEKTSPKPSPTRIPVEFDTSTDGKVTIEMLRETWDWPRVQRLLDHVSSLSNDCKTTDSNADTQPLRIQVKEAVEEMAQRICPLLPGGKGELREILASAKRWNMDARRGSPEAKAVLKGYRLLFRALAVAVRYRLAEIFCEANWRNWDKRALKFYTELQFNLGKFRRLHFLTLTFTGDPTYERVCALLADFTKNRLYRQGFERVAVVAFHPEEIQHGRLHVHMLCWSKQARSLAAEKSAIEGIRVAISQRGRGIGFTTYSVASGAAEILKVSAYLALNYSLTLKQPKGLENPIPKGAHVLRPPQNSLPGVKWIKVGKFALVTRATTDWRRAVSRYAAVTGRPMGGDLRWIWRERRRIRAYLEPSGCLEVGVTGLDGYTYRVIPEEPDHLGEEIYRLSSDEHGDFYLTQFALEDLASFQIAPGALTKNPHYDLTTGKIANYLEVLGMRAYL